MTVEQITEFKSQIREALESGATYDSLREVLKQYYDLGCSKSEAYETLQQLWLEYGYDDDEHDQPDPRRDELEYLLERVWYFGH
jgi:hypothetical protein